MKGKLRLFTWIILAVAIVYAGIYFITFPRYTYTQKKLPGSFEEFYREKLKISAREGVKPGNEERLLRASPGKTPIAILYIHGFTASRAEGEEVMDRAARREGANIYYLRVPGHGTSIEDLARYSYRDFLDASIEALLMMPKLGERVVVAGTSMGGTIATWLAANYPDKVDGVILCSPFYDYVDPMGRIFEYPGGQGFAELLKGKINYAKRGPTSIEGWQGYWYGKRYFSSVKTLDDLRKLTANDSAYRNITDPVLLLYYYRDEKNQDSGASVAAMKDAYGKFNGGRANPKSRAVAIADGDHVLMSKWVKADRKKVEEACVEFLRAIR